MTDNHIPDHLPLELADPKPWYGSTTILSGIASILSGLGGVLLVLIGQAPPDTMVPSLMAIGAGIGAVRGRLNASQPIAKLGG